jgi:hypothetical protein
MTLAETLESYVTERKALQAQSLEISDKLSKAKFGKRGALRRTLRKLKRSLRRMDRQIRAVQNEMRKENKNDVQEILASQGIDGKSNQLNAIASITGEVAKGVTGAMGGGMAGVMGGIAPAVPGNTQRTQRYSEDKNSNMLLYGGGAAALVLIYMMMKKK